MIKLRLKKEGEEKGGFKVPGGLIIPILAVCAICWFIYHIPWQEKKAISIFFVILTVVFFINKKVRKRKDIAPL